MCRTAAAQHAIVFKVGKNRAGVLREDVVQFALRRVVIWQLWRMPGALPLRVRYRRRSSRRSAVKIIWTRRAVALERRARGRAVQRSLLRHGRATPARSLRKTSCAAAALCSRNLLRDRAVWTLFAHRSLKRRTTPRGAVVEQDVRVEDVQEPRLPPQALRCHVSTAFFWVANSQNSMRARRIICTAASVVVVAVAELWWYRVYRRRVRHYREMRTDGKLCEGDAAYSRMRAEATVEARAILDAAVLYSPLYHPLALRVYLVVTRRMVSSTLMRMRGFALSIRDTSDGRYRIWSHNVDAGGRPLLVFPGVMMGAAAYIRLACTLGAVRPVHIIEVPNMSGGGPFSDAQCTAAVLARVAASVPGGERADVCGHSLGCTHCAMLLNVLPHEPRRRAVFFDAVNIYRSSLLLNSLLLTLRISQRNVAMQVRGQAIPLLEWLIYMFALKGVDMQAFAFRYVDLARVVMWNPPCECMYFIGGRDWLYQATDVAREEASRPRSRVCYDAKGRHGSSIFGWRASDNLACALNFLECRTPPTTRM